MEKSRKNEEGEMTKVQAARVLDATVRIDRLGGQGVLVHGGFILTATHCMNWAGDGRMALGDHPIEAITTKDGKHLSVWLYAADPVSDIAVLGSLDGQDAPFECDEFEGWSEATPPVSLANITPRYNAPTKIQVLTHKGKWTKGRIANYAHPKFPQGCCLALEADDPIVGGTSGGPVVDSDGRLVGVVSQAGDRPINGKYVGMLPIVHLALPHWVLQRIKLAAKGGK
jgi:hypothetical protein